MSRPAARPRRRAQPRSDDAERAYAIGASISRRAGVWSRDHSSARERNGAGAPGHAAAPPARRAPRRPAHGPAETTVDLPEPAGTSNKISFPPVVGIGLFLLPFRNDTQPLAAPQRQPNATHKLGPAISLWRRVGALWRRTQGLGAGGKGREVRRQACPRR